MAASLALFLSVPVGPVGLAAGERLLQDSRKDFVLIGAGCIAADVLLALVAVTVTKLFPSYDVSVVYNLWYVWLLVGGGIAGLGVYLLTVSPETVGKVVNRHPFMFGFAGTASWPTTFTGIFAAFGGAQLAGWMPDDYGSRILVALSLGVGTLAMWLVWYGAFSLLRRQTHWNKATVALWVHRAMALGLVAVGVTLAVKPTLI